MITDHKQVRALDAARRSAPGLHAVQGAEAKIKTPVGRKYAHINVFPLALDGIVYNNGRDMAQHVDSWRARARKHPVDGVGERVLVQANHPRGLQVHYSGKPSWGPAGLFARDGLVPFLHQRYDDLSVLGGGGDRD